MARTLWPMGSIVCFEGFEDIPYTESLERVVPRDTQNTYQFLKSTLH